MVILAKGLPGSGKSFTVNKLIESLDQKSFVVCSADHFFYNTDGIYKFDATKLGVAHGVCKAKFVNALNDKIPNIIIDNTNLTYSEVKDYIEYAAVAGYGVKLIESAAPWAKNVQECFKRNAHGVPLEKIQKMADRYQSNEHIAEQAKQSFNIDILY